MRRSAALFAALALALGLAACDRTDKDFGDNGVVRTDIVPQDLVPAPSTSGFFVTGGRPGDSAATVAWMGADGTTSWTKTLPPSIAHLEANGAAVRLGGGDPRYGVFVVGLDADDAADPNVQVALVGSDGELVESYGDNGIASTDVVFERGSVSFVVTGYDGQRATVVGRRGDTVVLVRLAADGAVERVDEIAAPLRVADALALPGGDVLVAGSYITARGANDAITGTDMAVLRVTPSGALRSTFGTRGIARVSFDEVDFGSSLVVRPDGRLVVGGYTRNDGDPQAPRWQLALAGLTATGQPDSSFGIYARSLVDVDNEPFTFALAVGGPGFVAAPTLDGDVRTFGFKQNGAIEDSWGEHGRQVNDLGDGATIDIALIPLSCSQGTCSDKERFIVAATTAEEPNGALLGLKP